LLLEGQESIQIFTAASNPARNVISELNNNAANSLPQGKVYIYDSAYHLLHATPNEPPPAIATDTFRLASSKQSFTFTDNDGRACILIYERVHGRQYYILATAVDIFGSRKSDNLRLLLFCSALIGLLLSGLLAFFYVTQAMKPLEELKNQIEKIDEKNLKERIVINKRDSEVWQIARKFNAMLDRLQQAFEQRKSFVQHASHELRTPLANMLSHTEAALGKDMQVEDYRKVLVSLKEDQQDLINLTNSLLTLSRYEKLSFVPDSPLIQIDEILYETVHLAKQTWPNAMVLVDFETVPHSQSALEFRGNEFLIKSAVLNLLKNALQYSCDNRVKVGILADDSSITLHFENTGQQLSAEEQMKLFMPFFRGENAVNKKGYGLGLSIVQRIIHVHNGMIRYQLVGKNVNRFTIYLPSGKE
jgi:signal transduction histidine kinase